jgi:hypothetical protein
MINQRYIEKGRRDYQSGLLALRVAVRKKIIPKNEYERILEAISRANPYEVSDVFRMFLPGNPTHLFTPEDIASVVESPRFMGNNAGPYFLFDPKSDKNFAAAPVAFLAKEIVVGDVKVNVFGRYQHFIAFESLEDLTGDLDGKLKIWGAEKVAKKLEIELSEEGYGTCFWGLPQFPLKTPKEIKGRILPTPRRVFRANFNSQTSLPDLATRIATAQEAMRENWLYRLGSLF